MIYREDIIMRQVILPEQDDESEVDKLPTFQGYELLRPPGHIIQTDNNSHIAITFTSGLKEKIEQLGVSDQFLYVAQGMVRYSYDSEYGYNWWPFFYVKSDIPEEVKTRLVKILDEFLDA